jgi:hypothetical protein
MWPRGKREVQLQKSRDPREEDPGQDEDARNAAIVTALVVRFMEGKGAHIEETQFSKTPQADRGNRRRAPGREG